jgi:hypothetical protein
VAGQSPQLGRTGQDRGQSPCGEVGEEVLAVGGTGEAGDDPCRDGEGLHGRGSGAAVGAIGVLAGPQPVHDVDGGESEGDRQRDRGEASTEAQTVVERMPACLCPAEERTAEARRAESPGRLAHGPRSGSSARGGRALRIASPRGTAAQSTAIVAARCPDRDVPSPVRNRAVAASASCAPAASR